MYAPDYWRHVKERREELEAEFGRGELRICHLKTGSVFDVDPETAAVHLTNGTHKLADEGDVERHQASERWKARELAAKVRRRDRRPYCFRLSDYLKP